MISPSLTQSLTLNLSLSEEQSSKDMMIPLTTSRSILSLRRNPLGIDRALCIADSAWCGLYNKQKKTKNKISLAMWIFFFFPFSLLSPQWAAGYFFQTHLQTNLRIGRIHFTLVTGSRAGSSIGKTMLFAMSKKERRNVSNRRRSSSFR